MSGSRVPYHLRTNKFVERQLFLDLIDFVRIWNGPKEYVYSSMGGQFLVDFKAIHDRFGFEKLYSIEMNETAWKRQKFNMPLGYVECIHKNSHDFVKSYSDIVEQSSEESQAIVWLDYAAANQRGTQLQEFETLIEKLVPGDLAKITVNANPQSKFQIKNYKSKKDFTTLAVTDLNEQLGPDYLPVEGIQPHDLKPKEFAMLLASCIKRAILKGLSDADSYRALPLGCYRYSDGNHQMLTVTALVADDNLYATVDKDAAFREWTMRSKDWDHVHEIDLPELSLKETLHVNSRIGRCEPNIIHDSLPFRFEENDADSFALLRSYIAHYRRYPKFSHTLA